MYFSRDVIELLRSQACKDLRRIAPAQLRGRAVQVAEARETEKAIMIARNKYRGVAARGAMLFFLLNSLNKIHAFYQFSLNAFVIVFARGIDNAPFGRVKKAADAEGDDADAVPAGDDAAAGALGSAI